MKERFAKLTYMFYGDVAEVPAYIYAEDETNISYLNLDTDELRWLNKKFLVREQALTYNPEEKKKVREYLKRELREYEAMRRRLRERWKCE